MSDSFNRQYRPAFHLAPPQGWMNDPVGFIHWQGAWHLFYQYHPHAPHWGPMHWGHARSADLVHWEHLPIALTPDSAWDQGGCFSGSACESADGSLIVMYTGIMPDAEGKPNQIQCLARSSDGIRFDKSHLNPAIGKHQIPEDANSFNFRDPRVILRSGTAYALIGSSDSAGHGQVLLYHSPDFITWKFKSVLLKGNDSQGTMWECPDLFTLDGTDILMVSPQYMPPDGDAYNNLHSVIALTGTMNWEQGCFHPASQQPLDWGFDFYAPQTALAPDGRRILIAWMDMWEQSYPSADLGHGWAGAMTLPRELTLRNGRICSQPVQELSHYHTNPQEWKPFILKDSMTINHSLSCFELICDIDPLSSSSFGITFFTGSKEETRLTFTAETLRFMLDRSDSGLGSGGVRQVAIDPGCETIHLQIFMDRSSLEVFINRGEAVISARVYPKYGHNGLTLWSQGNCVIMELKLWDLEVS